MRLRWRLLKTWCLGAILCGLQMLGGLAEAADGEIITDARAYLQEVNEAMAGLTSYHFVLKADIRSPLGDANMTGEGDFLLKPELKYRNMLNCTLTDLSGKQTNFAMTQYLEQVGNAITSYSSDGNGAWRKNTVSIEETLWPYDIDAAMMLVKSVEIEEQTQSQVVLAVTVDNKAILEMVMGMMKQGMEQDLDKAKAVIAQMSDAVYRLHVDKATHYVSRVHMDASEEIKNFLVAVLGAMQVPSKDRENFDALIQGIEVVVVLDNSAFDQVKQFDIPRKVLRNVEKAPKAWLPDAAAIGIIGGQDAEKKAI